MDKIIVRDATSEDAKELAVLAGQLGYPCTENEVKERMIPYLQKKDAMMKFISSYQILLF